jgi:hypothetical protein
MVGDTHGAFFIGYIYGGSFGLNLALGKPDGTLQAVPGQIRGRIGTH